MFTSGVLAIFEDVLSSFHRRDHAKMSWPWLFRAQRDPGDSVRHEDLRKHVRDKLPQARRPRRRSIPSPRSTSRAWPWCSCSTARGGLPRTSPGQLQNRRHGRIAIFAYALYYPIVEFPELGAIALVIWQVCAAVLRNLPFAWPERFMLRGSSDGNTSAYSSRSSSTRSASSGRFRISRQIQHPAGGDGGKRACLHCSTPRRGIASPDKPVTPAKSGRDLDESVSRRVFTYETLSRRRSHGASFQRTLNGFCARRFVCDRAG